MAQYTQRSQPMHRLALWLAALDREDLLEKSKSGKLNQRVCGDHFGEEHFKYIRNLNKDAIPCYNLPSSLKEPKKTTKKRGISSKHNSINTKNLRHNSAQTVQYEMRDSSAQTDQAVNYDLSEDIVRAKCTSIVQTSVSSLDTPQNTKLPLELKLENDNKHLLIKNEDCIVESIEKKTFLKWCDEMLHENSSNIVKCHASLIDKFKGNKYTMDLKLFSLHIYICSPHAYRFLQSFVNYPSITTLRKMQIPMSTGINDYILKVLQQKISKMNDKEKMCALCIDAMPLNPRLCYEVGRDKIHGSHEIDNVVTLIPAENAVVIMAHGLFVNWKQPIGYALTAACENQTELALWIDKVIRNLLGIGFDVRAIVTGLGSNILSASKARNICTKKTWFEIDSKKIYYIFDAPSLMKHTRNSLMSYNFCYGIKIAKWQHIEHAYEKDRTRDLKLMNKLSGKHFKPNYFDKTQVELAAQVFSRTVASAMSIYVAVKLIDEAAKDTIELINFFNNLFDMLNSSTMIDNYIYKRAYQGKEYQKNFFLEAIQLLESLDLKHDNKTPKNIYFINGLIITMNSVMGLSEDLKREGYNFLLTKNLNLDYLETFFNQIRQQGRNCTKPTVIQFNRAFKKLLLVNILKPTKQGNCEDDLNSILFKVNDYVNKATGERDREKSVLTSLNVGTSDYKFHLPKRNVLIYITGYLLRKCIHKHACDQMIDYFITGDTLSVYCNQYNTSDRRAGVAFMSPLQSFIKFVQSLETIVKEYFKSNNDDLLKNIGANLMTNMKGVIFEGMPCPCFPLDFLKKLYIRLRIFALIRENNKNYRRNPRSLKNIRVNNFEK